MSNLPSISDFYAGKNIFITGATGFIGKVIIEKLLRSCPDIKTIYILVRPKRTKGIEERIQDLVKCKIFDRVRKDQPKFFEKLIPIHGDISMGDLGIQREDLGLLTNNVHVVIHSAATVKFDEPLRIAMEMNVKATRKMVVLAHQLKHLKAFVHVSTAYANCDRPCIEETVYDAPVDPQNLIEALDWMDDDIIDQITPKLIGNKPNTYTFTKHIAEYLLLKEGKGLPLAIVRPSIVGAAVNEPFPGWIDSVNGPSGLCIATGKGLIRSIKGNVQALADIVPVDYCANMTIAVGWYTAVKKPSSCLIYHSTTGSVNPCTWGELGVAMIKSWRKVPADSCFRRPQVSINGALHDFYAFMSHTVPGYVMDIGCRMVGKKPKMMKLYNRINKEMDILSFFVSNSWEWTYNNSEMLTSELSLADRKCFCFDPSTVQWPSYVENYCLGTKKYILNEDLSDVPAAKARLRKLNNIRYCFNTILILAFCRGLMAASANLVIP